jgi:putative membrane protein (TIGR04086 family)
MKRRRVQAARALIRGVLAAAAITLIGMLILSAAIIFVGMSDGLLRAMNQLLKVASVALGAYLGVGRGGERGLVTGAGIGGVYAVLGYALYALLGENGFQVPELLGELLLSVAAGATAGAVFANLKPSRKSA